MTKRPLVNSFDLIIHKHYRMAQVPARTKLLYKIGGRLAMASYSSTPFVWFGGWIIQLAGLNLKDSAILALLPFSAGLLWASVPRVRKNCTCLATNEPPITNPLWQFVARVLSG